MDKGHKRSNRRIYKPNNTRDSMFAEIITITINEYDWTFIRAKKVWQVEYIEIYSSWEERLRSQPTEQKRNYSAINIYLGIVFCGRPALLEENGSKLIWFCLFQQRGLSLEVLERE